MRRIDLQWKFLVLLSIFSVVLCDWVPPKPQNQKVCNSPICKERGSEYFNNMMRKVHPCEDFYTFACGAWEKSHPSPPYTEWDVAYRMDQDTLVILKGLIEELPSRQTDNEMAKLRVVYNTCLEIPYFDKHKPEEIKKEVERIRRYPVNQVWDRHNEYLKLTGESALFDIDVGGFDDSLNLPMLQFSEVESAYGSIYHDPRWQPPEEQSYMDALLEMMSSLGLPDSRMELNKQVVSAYQFRRKLNLMLEAISLFDPDEVPEQTSPNNLGKKFLRFVIPLYRDKYTLALPWEKITKILFPKITPPELKKKIIKFHKSEYFKKLANLLAASTEQQIADHMEIYFVERHLRRTAKVKQLLKNSWKNPPAIVRALRFDEPRWMTCIKECGMTSTLAKLLINKWFKADHKEDVVNILTGVKTAIKSQVSESKWLDNDSKLLTIKRLDEVEDLIGEPTRHKVTSSPVKSIFPNAFLDLEKDVMFVNAAMLQSPVFDANIPVLYNLGSAGFLLGHEFYHVIDDCGHRRVTNARSFNLWSETMRNKCKERKQCFVREYNNFTELEFKRRYKLSPKVDTTESFLENYPDVMGLQAAHIFHSKLLKGHGGKCSVLPGFEGYSCDQMFFIAFANMFCGAPSAKSALGILEIDYHSINPVRVNGALSSTKAFADAFHCGKRDTMNPSTKCNLWI